MTDLPPAPPPLPPPPERFDAVLRDARARRQRRGVAVLAGTALFLAGAAGGLALDRPVSSVPADILRLARGESTAPSQAETSASVTPSLAAAAPSLGAAAPRLRPSAPDPTTGKSGKPARRETASTRTSPGTTTTAPSPAVRAALTATGVAVGIAGRPAAGLYVYPGVPGAEGFVPAARPVGRTAADGSFSLACTRTPVLLSPWPLNAPAGDAAATATSAATFVGGVTDVLSASDAPCTRTGLGSRTIVRTGSAVSGTVALAGDCATDTVTLRLRLFGEPALAVRVPGLRDGDPYRIGGLPPGRHTFGTAGDRSPLDLLGGESVTRDVSVVCDVATPTPTPSTTPEPSPTDSPPDAQEAPVSPSTSRSAAE